MLVRQRHGDHPGVVAASVSRKSERQIVNFGNAFRAKALAGNEGSWFSPPNPRASIADHPLVREADVINLHWVADFLATHDVVELLNLGKPVVWTMHDARPFTGGCHYTGGCDRFKNLCSRCPQLRPEFQHLAEASHALDVKLLKLSPRLSLVSPSNWLADQARHSAVFTALRTEVIPNNVDLSVFRPGSRSDFRRKQGWQEDAFVVLFGGSFLTEKRKGFTVLVDAIRRMLQREYTRASYNERRLIFATFGRDAQVLDGAGVCLDRSGPKMSEAEMAQLLQAADVYVCPSLEDNLPNTVMEAMACGLPVIATNVGGIPDMVEDGVNGYLVEPNDPAALAEALRRLLGNRGKLQEMGRRSRAICESRFGNGIQARAYSTLFGELLAAPRETRDSVREALSPAACTALTEAMRDCRRKLELPDGPVMHWMSKAKTWFQASRSSFMSN
jgi:glycosyltransferase involved in cell wall biosynthesis